MRMINSWFTLQKCANVFDGLYRGAVLERCVTFRKNELWLVFREHKPLLIHLGTPFQYCLTAREPLSLRRESVRIFPAAEGSIVESVRIFPAERVLRFSMTHGGALFLIFLSNRGNIAYMQDNITEFFKKRIRIDAQLLQENPAPEYTSLEEDPRFSPYWKRNIAAVLGTKEYPRILEILQNSAGAELNGRFVLLPQDAVFDPQRFYANYRKFLTGFLQESGFREEYGRLEGRITSELEHLQRQLGSIRKEKDLERRAEEYRYFADTLNACRHLLQAHAESFEIPEMYRNPDFPAAVPLRSDSDVQKNIDRYYERSRQLMTQIENGQKRREQLLQAYRILETAYGAFQKINHYRDLQAWNKDHEGLLKEGAAAGENHERRPYREFLLDGWRIRVGKSAKDNEELTFKFAAKTDLWLHVRHGTGSHVILKRDGKKQPPVKVLNYAAALAARFSEQKHSGLVTVVCTERKYVSKIKGAGPGKVRYQFERDILAEPASTDL